VHGAAPLELLPLLLELPLEGLPPDESPPGEGALKDAPVEDAPLNEPVPGAPLEEPLTDESLVFPLDDASSPVAETAPPQATASGPLASIISRSRRSQLIVASPHSTRRAARVPGVLRVVACRNVPRWEGFVAPRANQDEEVE
jgi:hypothetical protein